MIQNCRVANHVKLKTGKCKTFLPRDHTHVVLLTTNEQRAKQRTVKSKRKKARTRYGRYESSEHLKLNTDQREKKYVTMEPIRVRLIVHIFMHDEKRFCELRLVNMENGEVIERYIKEMQREEL